MSRPLKSSEKLLAGLLVAVMAVQGLRVLRAGAADDERAAAGADPSGARRQAMSLQIAQASTLDLAALEGTAGEIEVGRDPFRFAAPPPPPPRPAPPPPPYQPPPPAPPPGSQPPPVDVTYLGSFGSSAHRIAVFSDGKSILNAMRGDTLRGKFVVHAIGYESVDLTFVGFPDVPPERLALGG